MLTSSEYPSFETLKVTKVNTHGIVLHWQGSDKAALPVVMAAHQGTRAIPLPAPCANG